MTTTFFLSSSNTMPTCSGNELVEQPGAIGGILSIRMSIIVIRCLCYLGINRGKLFLGIAFMPSRTPSELLEPQLRTNGTQDVCGSIGQCCKSIKDI